MELSISEKIWNRAAMENGGETPGPGDKTLSSLLLLHGLVMNGGVHHALEELEPDEIAAAVDG